MARMGDYRISHLMPLKLIAPNFITTSLYFKFPGALHLEVKRDVGPAGRVGALAVLPAAAAKVLLEAGGAAGVLAGEDDRVGEVLLADDAAVHLDAEVELAGVRVEHVQEADDGLEAEAGLEGAALLPQLEVQPLELVARHGAQLPVPGGLGHVRQVQPQDLGWRSVQTLVHIVDIAIMLN